MSDFDFGNSVDIRYRFLTEGSQSVVEAIARLNDETKSTASTANQLQASFAKISRENQIDTAIQDARFLRNQIGDADAAAESLVKTLHDVGASGTEIEAAARKFSAFKSEQGGGGFGGANGLRTTGRALDQLGLNQIGEPIQKLGDLGQVAKEFKAISDQVPILTTVSEALTPALGATAAGFTAVAAPISLIAVAAIPLALAVKQVSDELDRSQKAYQAENDALKTAIAQRQQNLVDVRTKSSKQNIQDAVDAEANFKAQEDLIAQFKQRKADINKQYADLGSNFDPLVRKDLADKNAKNDKDIEDATTKLIELGQQARNLVVDLGPAINAREKEVMRIEDQNRITNIRSQIIIQNAQIETKIQNELRTLTSSQAQARLDAIADEKKSIQGQIEQLSALPNRTGDVTDKLKILGTQLDALNQESTGLSGAISHLPADIKAASNELTKLSAQIADVEAKRSEQLANRAQEDQRAGEVGVLEGQLAAALEQETAADNTAKLVKLRADEGDAEAQLLVKQAERINQINSQYFAQQAKALEAYQLSESRAEEDYSRTRLRKVEDMQSTLLNLGASRDVAGFVNARSASLTDLSRGDEDENTASQRRRQDFENQSKEADAARQQQLAALIVANEQETVQKRNALNKQLLEAQAAGAGQLKQSQILQAQLATLRQRFAVEDLAARRANEDAAYTTQINKLHERQAELNNIVSTSLNPAITFMSQLGTSVVNFINQIRNAASAPTSNVTSSFSAAGRNQVLASYANGTNYVPRTGLYQLHRGEAVVPAMQNRNYTPAWAKGRGGNTYVLNNTFGEIVTPSQMNAQIEMVISAIEQAAGVT